MNVEEFRELEIVKQLESEGYKVYAQANPVAIFYGLKKGKISSEPSKHEFLYEDIGILIKGLMEQKRKIDEAQDKIDNRVKVFPDKRKLALLGKNPQGLEKVFNDIAKEEMVEFDLESFKNSHRTLFRVIMKSMIKYREL